MSIFIPFAIRTRAAYPAILAYTRAVQAELPASNKFGAAGFCWGAMQTAQLCSESVNEDGSKPLIDAHLAAHPSGLKEPLEIEPPEHARKSQEHGPVCNVHTLTPVSTCTKRKMLTLGGIGVVGGADRRLVIVYVSQGQTAGDLGVFMGCCV